MNDSEEISIKIIQADMVRKDVIRVVIASFFNIDNRGS